MFIRNCIGGYSTSFLDKQLNQQLWGECPVAGHDLGRERDDQQSGREHAVTDGSSDKGFGDLSLAARAR